MGVKTLLNTIQPTLLIYVLLLYTLSRFIDWHLLDVVHNILNMQRYATSVAGQTCSGKAAKGGSHISASLKTFHCYDIVRQLYRIDMASLA